MTQYIPFMFPSILIRSLEALIGSDKPCIMEVQVNWWIFKALLCAGGRSLYDTTCDSVMQNTGLSTKTGPEEFTMS